SGTASTTQGTIVSTSPVLEVAVGDVPGGSTVTIRFNVRIVDKIARVVNQGYVSCAEIEAIPTDDPDTPARKDPTVTDPPMFNDASDVIKSDELKDIDRDGSISPGDLITYTVNIHNSGYGTAHHVVFSDSIPANTEFVAGSASTTHGDIVSSSPILEVAIGTLEGGAAVTIRFMVRVIDAVSLIRNQGYLVSDESEKHPTDDPDTPELDDPTVTDREDLMTDVSLRQWVYADSTDEQNTHYISEAGSYRIVLKVKNLEDFDAYNVRIVTFVPDSVDVISSDPVTPVSDSLMWNIEFLAAFDSVQVSLDMRVPTIMPFGSTYLISRSYIECDNEHPQKRSNNGAIDSVICFVPETPVLIPSIEVNPGNIDVVDSTQVRISIPENTISYELWIYLSDGTIVKDFADDFFNSTDLEPDVWYTIDHFFKPGRLLTDADREEVVFEIRITDNRKRFASERAILTVHSSDYLVLDRNVFRPFVDEHLEVRFKLSYRRTAVLDIYDIAGKHIHKLTEADYQGGWNAFLWDGMGDGGQRIGSGVYIITLRSGEFKSWKKFIIIR
ncbi:DUF11 domain-containing protein, partial [candidate division KSB1 bacterium]|nr:DUF11 domain-containing protein [candidate division KSB1 bacterium]